MDCGEGVSAAIIRNPLRAAIASYGLKCRKVQDQEACVWDQDGGVTGDQEATGGDYTHLSSLSVLRIRQASSLRGWVVRVGCGRPRARRDIDDGFTQRDCTR
jgi:hypothetical protein